MTFADLETVEFEGVEYDRRHGGPFDRGTADSWYSREFNPHFFRGATYDSPKVELAEMTAAEIVAYTAGYNYNERHGGKKDYD